MMTRLSLMFCLLLSMSSAAQQIKFEKQFIDDKFEFDYAWLDSNRKKQHFTFALDAAEVNNNYRHFKALRPSLLHMYSVRKLKQAASELDPKLGSVVVHSRVDRVEFEIRSTEQQWIESQSEKLSRLYEASLTEYLYQEYYTDFPGFYTAQNSKIYKPDHIRFAKESVSMVTPIVQELQRRFPRATARGIASFLLSWIQSIPYDTMESRAVSNGAGFVPPLRLLSTNKGDCDSKVTLMASIMKAMFPTLRIAIIYVPGHALIGMNVSHLEEDEKLDIDGLDYTLSEPVGPGLLPFATISERSLRYIASGNFKVELL